MPDFNNHNTCMQEYILLHDKSIYSYMLKV